MKWYARNFPEGPTVPEEVKEDAAGVSGPAAEAGGKE
jgi:hypothetical protein